MGLVVLAKKMLPVFLYFFIFYFTELQVVIVNWTVPSLNQNKKKEDQLLFSFDLCNSY